MDSGRVVSSRGLRRTQTLAEHRAWYLLRDRLGARLKFRLAVELDGGVRSQPSQLKRDKEKDE